MAAIKTTSIIKDQLLPSRKSVDVSKKDEGNATRSHAVQNEIRVTFSLVHGNSSIDGILKRWYRENCHSQMHRLARSLLKGITSKMKKPT
jgi:hypothetical protein